MAYIVSTYDPADDPAKDGDWTEYRRVDRPMQLRAPIRELYAQGYCNMSIAVDRVERRKGGDA